MPEQATENVCFEINPPSELVDFAERQVRHARFEGSDRRTEKRHLMVVPALLLPLDSSGRAQGPPFPAVTRDISTKAIGLIHTDSLRHSRLALHIQLAGVQANVIAELVWCQPLGPFYFSGCRFVEKLARFPSEAAEHALHLTG